MAKEKVKTLMVYDTDENGEEFEIDINTGEAVIRKIDYIKKMV